MCECECDETLGPYISTCNPHTKYLTRESNAWMTYINASISGYLLQRYCPMDYCHPPSKKVQINLNNIENGSDSQCAQNRIGLLCSSCQYGLSISLGSSRCISCPSYWPALCVVIFLAAILSGVGLIIIILFFNLTVAVGSLNGIIFMPTL